MRHFIGAPAVLRATICVDGLSVTHGSPRKHIWTFAIAIGFSKEDSDGHARAWELHVPVLLLLAVLPLQHSRK